GTVTSYEDMDVFCEEEETYRVEAIKANDTLISWSNIQSERPLHEAPTQPKDLCLATVFEDTFVLIQWSLIPDIPYARELIIEKDAGNGYTPVYRQAASDATLSWTDESVKVHDQSYRYRAFVTDSCGEQTPIGRIAQSIHLAASRQVGNVFFNWNPYADWAGGIRNYRLEVFNEATQNFESVSDIGASFTEFIDRETNLSQREYCYRLFADESGGKELSSVSNIVCVPIGPQIFYPNAFTPNGDQHNERFTITSLFVEEARIMIFNRWGEKLFESSDLNSGWDGLYKGKPVQEGVYVFRVEGVGYDGTLFSQAGTLTLIR
ncbi:MAG: gliding motility-associated C-terminal domain-containing protein, partial [Bacteroidota bacterium]